MTALSLLTPDQRAALYRDRLWPRLETLLTSKAQVYGTPEDVHANYRAIERAGITTTRLAMLARAVEKLQRLIAGEQHPPVAGWRVAEAEDLLGILCNYWSECVGPEPPHARHQ